MNEKLQAIVFYDFTKGDGKDNLIKKNTFQIFGKQICCELCFRIFKKLIKNASWVQVVIKKFELTPMTLGED